VPDLLCHTFFGWICSGKIWISSLFFATLRIGILLSRNVPLISFPLFHSPYFIPLISFPLFHFAGVAYGIRLEYKAFRRQELHSALSAQLDTLIELASKPEADRVRVWRAIVTAPGGPGEDFSIERAIAVQIAAIDKILAGEDVEAVPTYGRPPQG
jgi:hypothetical protein